jgi:hypothetical protein
MKNVAKKINIALAIIMFLALLLSFKPVADVLSNVTGWASNTIQTVARIVLGTAIGLYLISAGVAALAVPVVGIILIVVGVALVAWSLWPVFSKKKPDNTNLGGAK